MRTVVKKLKQNLGETITEVLIATLISSFGTLAFATMSGAAVKIAKLGIEKMAEYNEIESGIESSSDSYKAPNPCLITITETATTYVLTNKATSTVDVYGGGEDDTAIYAYKPHKD